MDLVSRIRRSSSLSRPLKSVKTEGVFSLLFVLSVLRTDGEADRQERNRQTD